MIIKKNRSAGFFLLFCFLRWDSAPSHRQSRRVQHRSASVSSSPAPHPEQTPNPTPTPTPQPGLSTASPPQSSNQPRTLRRRLRNCVPGFKRSCATRNSGQRRWPSKWFRSTPGGRSMKRTRIKLLHPASNMKIYTVAAALDRLSPDFRFKTSAYAPTQPD